MLIIEESLKFSTLRNNCYIRTKWIRQNYCRCDYSSEIYRLLKLYIIYSYGSHCFSNSCLIQIEMATINESIEGNEILVVQQRFPIDSQNTRTGGDRTVHRRTPSTYLWLLYISFCSSLRCNFVVYFQKTVFLDSTKVNHHLSCNFYIYVCCYDHRYFDRLFDCTKTTR